MQKALLLTGIVMTFAQLIACDGEPHDDGLEPRQSESITEGSPVVEGAHVTIPEEDSPEAYGLADVTEIPDPAPEPLDDLMDAPDVAAAPSCFRYVSAWQALGAGAAGGTTISCNAGQTMTGGGFDTDNSGLMIPYENYPPAAASWRAGFKNTSGSGIHSYTVWVRCCVL